MSCVGFRVAQQPHQDGDFNLCLNSATEPRCGAVIRLRHTHLLSYEDYSVPLVGLHRNLELVQPKGSVRRTTEVQIPGAGSVLHSSPSQAAKLLQDLA